MGHSHSREALSAALGLSSFYGEGRDEACTEMLLRRALRLPLRRGSRARHDAVLQHHHVWQLVRAQYLHAVVVHHHANVVPLWV